MFEIPKISSGVGEGHSDYKHPILSIKYKCILHNKDGQNILIPLEEGYLNSVIKTDNIDIK